MVAKKNKAAQSMVAMRWGRTSPEQRSEVARALNEAKWHKYYAAHPDKLKAKREREAKKNTEKAVR